MSTISELPLLGGLFEAIGTYFHRTAAIVRHPIQFLRSLKEHPTGEFRHALNFFVSSIIVSYIVSIPWFVKYDFDVSQPLYIISRFCNIGLLIVMIHIALMIIGKTKPLASTFIGYFYAIGFTMPLLFIVSMPLMMKMSPKYLFSNINIQEPPPYIAQSEATVIMASGIGFFVMGLAGMALAATALKIIHEQRAWKVIVASFGAILLYLPIYKYAYFPAWAYIEASVKAVVAFL